MLTLAPSIPKQWEGYQFHIVYDDEIICVDVKKEYVNIHTVGGGEIQLGVYDEKAIINGQPQKFAIPA